MIGRLRGTVAIKSPGSILVDVGGVGYEAAVSLSTFYKLPELGEPVTLLVETIMRDSSIELFAFFEARERRLFGLLRTVSGIGPKVALSILSGIDPRELESVVSRRDITRLVAIPGIGRKTAERLLVEVADKIGPLSEAEDFGGAVDEDAVSALLGLGYKRPDAEKVVRDVRASGEEALEAIIKQALVRLS